MGLSDLPVGERIGGPVRPVRAPATSTESLARNALDRAEPAATTEGRHAARGDCRAGQTVAAHALPPEVPQHHGAGAPRPACGRAAPAERAGCARAPARRSPGAAERRGRHSGAGLGDRADFISTGPARGAARRAMARVRRSVLFVPGSDRAALRGALEAGPDTLVVDLEDTVTPARKHAARALAVAFLGEPAPAHTERAARVNSPATPYFSDDLLAVIAGGRRRARDPQGELGGGDSRRGQSSRPHRG